MFEEEIDRTRTCGKRATYKAGCRCKKCRAANTAYHNGLNKRKRERGDRGQDRQD